MNRQIKKIILHCSDSDVPSHQKISVILDWHLRRGFRDVGYHYFINWGGGIEKGRDLNMQGAHCKGHNSDSIGICLGGRKKFTSEQFSALAELIKDLLLKYPHLSYSDIYGHNEFANKTCPNFNVSDFINTI